MRHRRESVRVAHTPPLYATPTTPNKKIVRHGWLLDGVSSLETYQAPQQVMANGGLIAPNGTPEAALPSIQTAPTTQKVSAPVPSRAAPCSIALITVSGHMRRRFHTGKRGGGSAPLAVPLTHAAPHELQASWGYRTDTSCTRLPGLERHPHSNRKGLVTQRRGDLHPHTSRAVRHQDHGLAIHRCNSQVQHCHTRPSAYSSPCPPLTPEPAGDCSRAGRRNKIEEHRQV